MPCVHLSSRKFASTGQDISLAPQTVAALAPLLTARATGYLIRIPHHGNDPPITTGDRARREAVRLRRILAGTCQDNVLPVITPHGLRHTFITLARDAGVPDRDIMAAAGWVDPRMITYYDRAHASVERNATHQLTDWLKARASASRSTPHAKYCTHKPQKCVLISLLHAKLRADRTASSDRNRHHGESNRRQGESREDDSS